MIVLSETHLRRLLRDYLAYYHSVQTHLCLDKDSLEPRAVQRLDLGRIVETPLVGGPPWSLQAAGGVGSRLRLGVPTKLSPRLVGSPPCRGFSSPPAGCRPPNGCRTRFIRTVCGGVRGAVYPTGNRLRSGP
jgi:hypothetical protein